MRYRLIAVKKNGLLGSWVSSLLVLLMVVALLASTMPATGQTQDFSSYVWNPRPRQDPSNVPADLQASLSAEVEKMIAAGHLAPLHLTRGRSAGQNVLPWGNHAVEYGAEWIWLNPGEVVYTLSYAYPYLSSTLQSQVKSYLAAEMLNFPPLKSGVGCWNGGGGEVDGCLSVGTRRELYQLPPWRDSNGQITFNIWPAPTPPIENLYAIWLYANNVGDWAYVSNNWSDALTVYNNFKASKTPAQYTYGEIGGVIGMARLAQQRGDTTLANSAASLAVQAMTAGQNFDQFVANTQSIGYQGDAPLVFLNLTPEVGSFLRDNARASVSAYLSKITGRLKWPSWHQARLDMYRLDIENTFMPPYTAWGIFMARAYALGDEQTALRRYLDIPWSPGDLYYIQKLVATIEGSSPSSSFSIFFGTILK